MPVQNTSHGLGKFLEDERLHHNFSYAHSLGFYSAVMNFHSYTILSIDRDSLVLILNFID